MEVSGISGNQPLRPVERLQQRPETQPPGAGLGGNDRVELSATAQWLNQLRQLPPIRGEKVDEVRSQIEAGRYLTDAKLDAALDRLLEELGI